MKAVRIVDQAGDWTFGNGRNNYATGRAGLAQSLSTRLKCIVNDWFLNFDFGIDYFGGTPYAIEQQIRKTILNTSGVTEIVSLESDFNAETRSLIVTTTILDEQGNLLEVTT